jgi:PAS domain S-box-containing protein
MTRTGVFEENSCGELKDLKDAAEPEESTTDCPDNVKLRQLADNEGFKTVFEFANDPMILIDNKGKIIEVNGRIAEISGYAKEEIIGKQVRALSGVLSRKSMARVVNNYLKHIAGLSVPPYEIELFKKDGEALTFEISAKPLKKDGKIFGELGILRDITRRKLADDEILEKSSDINLINIINEAANQGKDFEEIFRLVSGETQKLFGANVAIVYLLSKDKQYLEMQNLNLPPKMARGIENLIAEKISGVKIKLKAEGIYRDILNKGMTVLTNDHAAMVRMGKECTENKDLQKLVSPIIKGLGICSAISIPLKNDREAFGLLDIARHEPFTESDMKRIETITGQLVNIIKRKQAEEALKTSEQNFRTFLDYSSLGIRIRNTSEGIVYANQAFLDIFGYQNIEESKSHPPQEYYTQEEYANYLARSEKIKRGEPVDRKLEVDIIRKDGTVRHVQIFGHIVRRDGWTQANTFYNDITLLKKSESEIAEQQALTDRILGSTPNPVVVVGPDKRIVMVNKAFKHIFESTRDRLEGKEIGEIIPIPHLIEKISKLFDSNKSKFQVEFKFKRGLKEMVFVAKCTGMQKNEVLVILHDITEEREMQERLYQTDRLASLGEMAAGIAHELNNPLTGVVALSQLLLEGEAPLEIKADLEAISKEGQRAASVVKNLLSFARSHTLSNQPVEINAVINEVLNLRAYEHRVNNIEVITHFTANLPAIIADRFQMQQVFLNIVLNAEQAMMESRGRGNLTVTTERLNFNIRISFADDGPGIPPEILNRIFDPFFTTKDIGKGTGLGLSICYGIVTKQGDRIYAESQHGKGATFIIEFPLKHEKLSGDSSSDTPDAGQ